MEQDFEIAYNIIVVPFHSPIHGLGVSCELILRQLVAATNLRNCILVDMKIKINIFSPVYFYVIQSVRYVSCEHM
jgi:hypothetical protein